MKRLFTNLLFAVLAISTFAAPEAVQWQASIDTTTSTPTLVINANISDGWHIYGIDLPQTDDIMMPDPTTITLTAGAKPAGELRCQPATITVDDAVQEMTLTWHVGETVLTMPIEIEGDGGIVEGYVSYMACTEESCTPPARFDFAVPVSAEGALALAAEEPESADVPAVGMAQLNSWWDPVEVETESEAQSGWGIFIFGFLGGLVALLTPCVWPMIPMTVSFFLKKNKSRSIMDATLYAVSIIVIFLILGILITLIFGPGKLNEIATSALFNVIFFLLLVVFAISFFGAFEITLPSSWSNAMDNRAENTTGLLSIFFMAFTLVLVSFSCTGPIIGTLLVEAFSQSNLIGPLLGMGGFALGLALPFGLFAFFPSMLKELPRSGSWLNTVKVVLGFIELILSLKFLSVADLAYGWHILDREVFLAIWIVLFILLGIYLLGKLRFSHDGPQEHTSVSRFFLAVASFSFAVYLLPGMWGAPLKAVSAFAPPLYTQDFNLYGGTFDEYDDYDLGMAAAQATGKPVLVDFSGYACVNCRKMEGAVFDNPSVRAIIERDFIMIKLMVDDKASLPMPINVVEEGKKLTLKTVGDRWAFLQRYKFGINSQPYYVMLDNEGKPLAAPRVYDENVGAFVGWLEEGAEAYRTR